MTNEVKQQNAKQHLIFAIICICFASLNYTVSSIFVKFAAKQAPTNIILFFRYSFFLICLLPMICIRPKIVVTQFIFKHIARGIFGILSIFCFYFAVQYVPLTRAVLLSVSTPLFIPIVLRVTRNIKIIPQLYWGMGIGLVGVAFVLHPKAGVFHIALIIALFSAIFRAISSTFVRQISKLDSTFTILFYYFLVGTIASGISLLFNLNAFSHLPWIYLLLIAFFGALYQIFLSLGYKFGPARLVSPFIYLSVVYAALADWLIWQETLSITALIGIALVFIGAILTVYMGRDKIISH